jgi:hypothetical protein
MVLPENSFHCQTFSQELLPPEVVTRDSLRVELTLDDDLRRDPGVIGTRLPQRVVAPHAMIARQRIHDRLVEAVPHVQGAGDVGRRQQDAEGALSGGIQAGSEVASGFPFGYQRRSISAGSKLLASSMGVHQGVTGARIIPDRCSPAWPLRLPGRVFSVGGGIFEGQA